MCWVWQVYKKLGQNHLAQMNFSWAIDLDPKGANNQIKEAINKRYLPDDDDNTTMGLDTTDNTMDQSLGVSDEEHMGLESDWGRTGTYLFQCHSCQGVWVWGQNLPFINPRCDSMFVSENSAFVLISFILCNYFAFTPSLPSQYQSLSRTTWFLSLSLIEGKVF